MIVEDSEVEIKKFKMYAEKADSEAKIVDLCKKYLKHKGIDVDAGFADYFKPKEPERIYVGMTDIIKINAETVVDGVDRGVDRSARQTSDQMMFARKSVIDKIVYDVIRNDMIKFNTYEKMDTWQTIVHGRLNVWKDPTK
jgi:hypothetical protein